MPTIASRLCWAICAFLLPAFCVATEPAPENPAPPAETVEPAPVDAGKAIIPEITPVAPPTAAADAVPPAVLIETDLWERVRRGFALQELNSPLIRKHEQWYANRPDYIQRFVERGSRYLYHVVEEVERRGMPTEIVLLPIIESAFNPQAFSRAQAAGMWQFIPSTGKLYGLPQDWSADHRRDVILSTNAALDYLQKLYAQFNSWELAFAAYNCGEGCVARAILKNERKKKPTDFAHLNLPTETKNYVPKLMAVKNIVMAPGSFNVALGTVVNRPYFTKVDAPEHIDVDLAARLAEMPLDEFAALNPAFIKPVASSRSGYFLVPIENAALFRSNLEQYRSLNGPLVSWQTVNAKRGESVENVARRNGMTASFLRATNGPFKERKGKFTQPVTIMAPIAKDAEIIRATLDRKGALKGGLPPPEPNTDAPLSLAPVRQTELNREIPAPAVAETVTATLPSEPVPSSYVVQAGDTLFSIANRFGLTVTQLQSQNQLRSSAIDKGQRLSLTGGENRPVAAPKATFYVVESGDTLSDIADKFSISLASLLRWNGINATTVINPGKRLKVGS
ncbi:MAG: LysM peptidoglycan-binding domain-containing protein [Betaproteobacteria bacterium]|nr:LysM peptidoglycan-binding domain-containing protein [Betaproteobacteria bacterium]